MKAKRITITNVMGIAHLVIEPGAVTLVRGPNGAGKTSVMLNSWQAGMRARWRRIAWGDVRTTESLWRKWTA